jgi:hypothetical protein
LGIFFTKSSCHSGPYLTQDEPVSGLGILENAPDHVAGPLPIASDLEPISRISFGRNLRIKHERGRVARWYVFKNPNLGTFFRA